MCAAPALAKQKGVCCRYCGKGIQVSQSILGREKEFRDARPNDVQKLGSRVFSQRCKRCGGEALYFLAQIAEIE